MSWIVNSSLIDQSVISRFCAPASTKPRRNPITPSPALASPEPVSQADKVTNQVPGQNTILFYGRRFAPFPGINRRVGSRQRQAAAVHRVLEELRFCEVRFKSRRLETIRILLRRGLFGLEEAVCRQVQDVRTVQIK